MVKLVVLVLVCGHDAKVKVFFFNVVAVVRIANLHTCMAALLPVLVLFCSEADEPLVAAQRWKDVFAPNAGENSPGLLLIRLSHRQTTPRPNDSIGPLQYIFVVFSRSSSA
jgi:hypothetical protein